jgi:hypothetical protein
MLYISLPILDVCVSCPKPHILCIYDVPVLPIGAQVVVAPIRIIIEYNPCSAFLN